MKVILVIIIIVPECPLILVDLTGWFLRGNFRRNGFKWVHSHSLPGQTHTRENIWAEHGRMTLAGQSVILLKSKLLLKSFVR